MFKLIRDNSVRFKSIDYFNKLKRQKYSTQQDVISSADVVIVGGGIVGCNTLYQLSKRGIKTVLLERSKITSGTTWHTAGMVWSLRPCDLEIRLLQDSKHIYSILEEEIGDNAGWINNGGLFISRGPVRTQEYMRLHTLGKSLGIPSEILNPQEAQKIVPILDPSVFKMALYSPGDGTIDPAIVCSALIKVAKKNGGMIYEDCPVRDILYSHNMLGNKEVTGVHTDKGFIKTKCVVNCGGAWGGRIARYAGVPSLPLIPFKHAYVVMDALPEVRGCPNVRDHDASVYLKIQGETVNVGGYETNPHMLDEVPDNLSFHLYELDWDVFGIHMTNAADLCPKLGQIGVKSTVCGPESFTPDHKPLLGEDPNVFGLYHNCGYNSAGMMFSPGCAIQMAEWIVSGRPNYNMFTFDIRRFTPGQMSRGHWMRESSHEAYCKNYCIVFPHDEPLAGRDCSHDALHQELLEDGAVMQARAGWERPAFYLPGQKIRVQRYDWGGTQDYPRNVDLRYEKILEGDYSFNFSEHHNLKRFSHEKNDDLSTMGIGENSKSEIHVERENAAKRKRSKDTNGLDNKENDLKSSKKLKKEPGLSKPKIINTRNIENFLKPVIMIVPKDDNSTKNSRNLEKTKIVEEDTEIPPGPSSNELPQLLNKPRTSTFSDNKTKDEMETYPDNVSEANTVETTGKDKKKKKHHHSKDEKLMTQIDEMQHELHEMRSEQKVQRQMLQQVLDFCNEYKETPSNQESHELEKKTGVPKVGFTRVADNSVHLGQGIYVPKNSYLTASSRSKSTSQFVRKMIMAVFTAEELQASSVHGAKSNKIKQNEQKPGLDPTRLQAVKDIFSYYLQEIKMPVHKYDQEMKAFYSYVSSKITDTRAESKRLPKIGEEALACRNGAALFNMSYYGKFYITGPDAQRTADLAFTADMSNKADKVVYTLLLNEKGGVEADVTVTILLDGGSGQLHEPIFKGRGYYVVTSGFCANHVLAHLRRIVQTYKLSANICDVTKQMCILSIQGPDSQRILQRYTTAGLSNDAFPVSTHRSIHISKAPHSPDNKLYTCRALRIGWAGELGWELHVPSSHAIEVYKALSRAKGLRNAGWRALTSLSAEKGYHLWNSDLRPDDNPIEANLGFTCRKDGDYIGNEYVTKAKKGGLVKKYAYFTLDEKLPLFGGEAIFRNNELVGYLRRGDYAYYLDKPIGIGYVHNNVSHVTKDYLKSGEYKIEVMGTKHKATLHLRSPFDPNGQRILGNYGELGMDENTHEPHAGQNERAGGSE